MLDKETETLLRVTRGPLVRVFGFGVDSFDLARHLLRLKEDDPSQSELLFDIAHIDDYAYMKDIVKIKYPKLLHCADRNFNIPHEHLPLGQGDIDFKYIFNEIIPDYSGGIIFEISDSNEDRLQGKNLISKIVNINNYS